MLEARREIKELNRHFQKKEGKDEVNLKDKLSKQKELVGLHKKWKDMQAKMEAMEKWVATRNIYINLEMLRSFPFTQEVDVVTLPQGFNLPTVESYDETVDPIDHIKMFRTSMSIQGVSDAIMCKVFLATIKKATISWFFSLKLKSISTFKK